MTPRQNGFEQATIVELQRLVKNSSLTIYEMLLSFLQRNELVLNRSSASQENLIDNDNELFHILSKYYISIKEFFDFIEQLQMIIKENEHSKIESMVTFRKLLELISKQLCKDESFNRHNLIVKDLVEEFCQYFQTKMSVSSDDTLVGHHFLQSVAYFCTKQTIDLPIFILNDDHKEVVSSSKDQDQQCTSHRCFNLSIIHETSFESDSLIDNLTASEEIPQPQSIIKRQPLQVIDVNLFNNEERFSENSIVLTLVSDDDKENLPVIRKKRPTISTKNEPS
ncbi:unnamed protein product, partial [Adineta steineri]